MNRINFQKLKYKFIKQEDLNLDLVHQEDYYKKFLNKKYHIIRSISINLFETNICVQLIDDFFHEEVIINPDYKFPPSTDEQILKISENYNEVIMADPGLCNLLYCAKFDLVKKQFVDKFRITAKQVNHGSHKDKNFRKQNNKK